MKKVIITIVLLVGISHSALIGQEESTITAKKQHALHLKNGSTLIGELEAYRMHEPAIIIMGDGERITVPYDLIESVSLVKYKKGKSTRIKRADKPYAFKERGWHGQGGLGLIERGSNFGAGGYSIDFGVSYQFHRLYGIGLNIGYDAYDIDANEKVIPVYLNIRGFLFPKKVTPYYDLGIGIGFSKINDGFNEDVKSNPGLLLYPKIGIRVNGGDMMNMTIFTGVKIQNTHSINRFGCDSTEEPCEQFIETDRTYRRLIIGAGFIF